MIILFLIFKFIVHFNKTIAITIEVKTETNYSCV